MLNSETWAGKRKKKKKFRVLMFGLSLSPRIFTMIVRFLVKLTRTRGIRIFAYLGDYRILASSNRVCRDFIMFVMSRLQFYMSPVQDPRTWTVDAFRISWKVLDAYAFTPLALIGNLLSKTESDGPRSIRVAPFWESLPYFRGSSSWLVLRLSTSGYRWGSWCNLGQGWITATLRFHAWML
jgi:hypothetical protein